MFVHRSVLENKITLVSGLYNIHKMRSGVTSLKGNIYGGVIKRVHTFG